MSQLSIRFFTVIVAASFLLHLFLIPQLYIIEDESAYMQDAAQITSQYLPFRDFGGTKGPLWLVLFRGWQGVFGHTLLATRLFSSLAHIASIFLLYQFVKSFRVSPRIAYIAAGLWALSPVVVSLTTNITHIPLELVCIFAAFLCLRQTRYRYFFLAGVLLFASLLMRATAIAFIPSALLLIMIRNDRWAVLWRVVAVGTISLLLTLAVIYPLYGWPKTAFFFNADATLIANKQREVYAKVEKISPLEMLYQAIQPIRDDGLSVLIPALFLPLALVWRKIRKSDFPTTLVLLIVVWIGSFLVFYKGWGRSPTPFYPLESIAALCIAAALTLEEVLLLGEKLKYKHLVMDALLIFFAVDLFLTFHTIPDHQYRGTVEVSAAEDVAEYLKEHVQPGEQIFTAQPVFPYLAGLPLYKGLTHPGWYLSERAGYLPTEIRQVFYPDMDVLTKQVTKDVKWIVLDWRTRDVYFNEGNPNTEGLRKLLETKFEDLQEVSNSASRDIHIYYRSKK